MRYSLYGIKPDIPEETDFYEITFPNVCSGEFGEKELKLTSLIRENPRITALDGRGTEYGR